MVFLFEENIFGRVIINTEIKKNLMKRKIFSQISLLLAIFTVVISLSACSTTTNTNTDNTKDMDENSGLIKMGTSTSPAYNQGEAPAPRTSQS